jgi:hypothetical protein
MHSALIVFCTSDFTGLVSIAGLFLAKNDLCMFKEGTVSADFAKRVPIWIYTVKKLSVAHSLDVFVDL